MGWKQISARLGLSREQSDQLAIDYQQKQEQQLLTALFRIHADGLYHFLLRQSNAEIAQDLSQQCWLKFLQQSDSYLAQSSFKTWLYSIGRHLLLDEFRRQQRWGFTDLDEQLVLPWQANPAELYQQSEQQRLLTSAINQLPLVQKEALLLQLEGFSLTEIALITQSQPETIKSRLRYARVTLASVLEAEDETP